MKAEVEIMRFQASIVCISIVRSIIDKLLTVLILASATSFHVLLDGRKIIKTVVLGNRSVKNNTTLDWATSTRGHTR